MNNALEGVIWLQFFSLKSFRNLYFPIRNWVVRKCIISDKIRLCLQPPCNCSAWYMFTYWPLACLNRRLNTWLKGEGISTLWLLKGLDWCLNTVDESGADKLSEQMPVIILVELTDQPFTIPASSCTHLEPLCGDSVFSLCPHGSLRVPLLCPTVTKTCHLWELSKRLCKIIVCNKNDILYHFPFCFFIYIFFLKTYLCFYIHNFYFYKVRSKIYIYNHTPLWE